MRFSVSPKPPETTFLFWGLIGHGQGTLNWDLDLGLRKMLQIWTLFLSCFPIPDYCLSIILSSLLFTFRRIEMSFYHHHFMKTKEGGWRNNEDKWTLDWRRDEITTVPLHQISEIWICDSNNCWIRNRFVTSGGIPGICKLWNCHQIVSDDIMWRLEEVSGFSHVSKVLKSRAFCANSF